jgi:hypothetical protein
MSTSGIQNSNDTTAVLEMVLMSASIVTHSFTQGLQLSILKTVNTRLIQVCTKWKTLHRPRKIITAAAPLSSSVAPPVYICHRCGIPTQ